MQPVYEEKALVFGSTLVVADLHIGIEHELSKRGVKLPSRASAMGDRIVELLERLRSERLVILGDLKHNIPGVSWQEGREVPDLVERLGRYCEVVVIKGNHDGGIEKMLPDIEVRKSLELDGDALLLHGNSWFGGETMSYDYVVFAHNHPCIEFVDELGNRGRETAWIRTGFTPRIRDFYTLSKDPEVIIMPAFNDLIKGMPFNGRQKLLGPFFNKGTIEIDNARAYLLDGTYLGEVKGLKRQIP